MRQVVGQILPLAVAAAISPIPIVGVVLMLVTPRAKSNGPMFIFGWLVGLAVVGTVGLTIAGAVGATSNGGPSHSDNTFQIVLGAALLVFAFRQWRKRPKPGEDPPMPKWMTAVDDFTPPKAAATGFVLSAVNPKNLLLSLAAATTIAATALSGADQVVAYVVYSLIATLGVAIPLMLYFAMGERSKPILADLEIWLARHNHAILAVIFLVMGAKVLGQGIGGWR